MGHLPDVPEEPGHRRGRDGGAGHRHRRGRHRRALSRPRRHRPRGALADQPAASCRHTHHRRDRPVVPGDAHPGRGRARVPRDPGRHLRPGARADHRPGGRRQAERQARRSSPTPRPSWPAASTTRRPSRRWPSWRCPTFADWCAIDVVEDGRSTGSPSRTWTRRRSQLARELAERYPTDPDAPERGVAGACAPASSELIAGDHRRDAGRGRDRRGAPAHRPRPPPAQRPHGAAGGAGQGPRRDHVGLGRVRAAATPPTTSRSRRTWPSGPRSPSTTPSCTARPWPRPSSCSTPCCPRRCRSSTGWEVASYYRPSGRTEVGGDFYDAVPLSDGRLALFVGDVMGRGVAAAAAMAQMRAAVRAYAAVDPTPEMVMSKLDLMFEQYPTDQLVTLVYLVVDPARRRARRDQRRPPAPGAAAGRRAHRSSCPGRRVSAGRAARGSPAGDRAVPRRRHRPRLHRRADRAARRGHQPRVRNGCSWHCQVWRSPTSPSPRGGRAPPSGSFPRRRRGRAGGATYELTARFTLPTLLRSGATLGAP